MLYLNEDLPQLIDYHTQKVYTDATKWQKQYRMAKFNKREFGGIYYKARPIGFRNWFNIYKVIPYILGSDIKVKLLIKRTERHRWWSEGTLNVVVDGKWEGEERVTVGSPSAIEMSEGYSFRIGDPNQKGRWSKGIRVSHPLYPCTISCYLNLQRIKEGAYSLPVTGIYGAMLFEDVTVITSYTAIKWGLSFFLAVALLVVGIWNLILIL